ncbi:MAG: hypoxanthine phosphoribosyltransferase [Opitutae bacterium]
MNALPQPIELLSADRIAERLQSLAVEINQHYLGREILLVSILDGAIIFTADLMRLLKVPTQLDCLRISSYGNATSPQSAPRITSSLKSDLKARHVLLVDDILDTGKTMEQAVNEITNLHPDSVRTCVFLDKVERRTNGFVADWVGFSIPNEFVVGYGLDYAGQYRELPYLAKLSF